VRLITNNPSKISALQDEGITVTARVPLEVDANSENEYYMVTKARRMDHLLKQSPQKHAVPKHKRPKLKVAASGSETHDPQSTN
jgi:hypothetical protein